MCVIFYYVNPLPTPNSYKLILVNNRDELYTRPTQEAHIWQTNPKIIAGKDEMQGREGGTWLGASQKGKIACLLNIFQPKDEFFLTEVAPRGFLALNFLLKDLNGTEYAKSILDTNVVYNKFSLLTFEPLLNSYNVTLFNNDDKDIVEIGSGCHGFGNSYLNKPFKKVLQGTTKIEKIVEKFGFKDREDELLKALTLMMEEKEQHYPDETLVNQGRGHPEPFYHGLSSIFVTIPEASYGTRTTTIILVDNNDELYFHERTMANPSPHCEDWHVSSFRIKIETPT